MVFKHLKNERIKSVYEQYIFFVQRTSLIIFKQNSYIISTRNSLNAFFSFHLRVDFKWLNLVITFFSQLRRERGISNILFYNIIVVFILNKKLLSRLLLLFFYLQFIDLAQ